VGNTVLGEVIQEHAETEYAIKSIHVCQLRVKKLNSKWLIKKEELIYLNKGDELHENEKKTSYCSAPMEDDFKVMLKSNAEETLVLYSYHNDTEDEEKTTTYGSHDNASDGTSSEMIQNTSMILRQIIKKKMEKSNKALHLYLKYTFLADSDSTREINYQKPSTSKNTICEGRAAMELIASTAQ
jgi:hypothetical protein